MAASATHNRRTDLGGEHQAPPTAPGGRCGAARVSAIGEPGGSAWYRAGGSAWYVARALGERPTSSNRSKPCLRAAALAILSAVALTACGSEPRQDANEPEGSYEVEVTTAKFPTDQQLVDTTELKLGVENTGEETVPELAFTIFINNGQANGSFDIRSNQRDLAVPSRPVWILENGFPRLESEDAPLGNSGGTRVQTQTYGFGPLEPGTSKTAVWKLTPVESGTYTLNYVVAAGLDGKAEAVTSGGGEVKGEFVVTISDKPPKTRVNDAGKVVPAK